MSAIFTQRNGLYIDSDWCSCCVHNTLRTFVKFRKLFVPSLGNHVKKHRTHCNVMDLNNTLEANLIFCSYTDN